MNCVIYARVSTEEQSTENQIPVLENWAKQRGWEVIRTYSENASAWKAGHQAELARLTQDARSGEFELVLIWALDRLCRGGADAIFPILNKLAGYGIKVYSYQESWTEQPSADMYKLLVSIFAWVAEWESKRRSERTKLGMAKAREKGVQIGRPAGSKDSIKRNRVGYLLREASYEQKRNFEKNHGGK